MGRIGFSILVLAICGSAKAVDRDDFYAEITGNTGLNVSGRYGVGGLFGYAPWDDFGLGLSFSQLFSTDEATPDRSGFRSSFEIRWFQEPFEFCADIGVLHRSYRDSSSQNQASLGVNTAYLIAVTPGLALKADFSFLFLDQPRVLFSGGLGARIVF